MRGAVGHLLLRGVSLAIELRWLRIWHLLGMLLRCLGWKLLLLVGRGGELGRDCRRIVLGRGMRIPRQLRMWHVINRLRAR